MSLAPIALFVYRRPEHTRRTIASLRNCPEFAASPVFVFSDGARDTAAEAAVAATRAVVAEMLPDAHVTIAVGNRGLAASVISGVDALTDKFGRVIVVEDDLVLARDFLTFLNVGLDRYENEPRVMQISGHMFGVNVGPDAVLLPFVSTWGWATWARAWRHFDPESSGAEKLDTDPALKTKFNLDGSYAYSKMLKRQQKGLVDSWGIRWYWSVFDKLGLVLYPPVSLVANEGFSDGTHGGKSADERLFTGTLSTDRALGRFPSEIIVSESAYLSVKAAFRARHSFSSRLQKRIKGLFA